MDNSKSDEIIFAVTVEDLQNDAITRIGRKLTDDELYTAKKCIESGLSTVIGITMKAAIDEAVSLNRQTEQQR
ncbi:MAG: hypothetical protein A2249_03100 [Candidatus Jacksonbacteria bacterium RIFOXYA2_FULL_44_7]|uniref:Uncharacterized protein n=1 Tax=Candidatus Jacksonbacteria bacterium RIFCSPLOWO2_02_FULL_44_20 TaxID=1798460 RepID=A0A1G2A9W2_9BACT|nr:MAG: hypothetical protein UW39_C0005G0009 [Parcubacteria group bacterium GW2011_GWC2_44_17]KKT48358.1 MAG: hypothetical protein UW40_C0046G0006 [Parcubacteria group bacterium GW2011_GWF2_44_17]OGY70212.1 MAG: hypothetical protein A3E05_03450 [Candidatus Jacksonbacteria bacterium RIFCSPHIGHO2_12_FULL_44_12]OGY70238.1 MAG: hypothetical protein A3C00_03120 [Candidatus Jacksonbacteria bacterium RIFCSPHIGHO2_02_FULL_44_25]OGY72830.1 MAG: hypothetical protein A3H61_04545 [Candidatus Jacksonbacteri